MIKHQILPDTISDKPLPVSATPIDSRFDELFIAFAETRLHTWMEGQDPSAPVNLADLSKAVNLYQRLRKMRQQASPQAPYLPISNPKSEITNPQPHAPHLPIPNLKSEMKSPQPASSSPSLATLCGIDPDLLSRDPEKLLKEARAMFRNPRPNNKKHRPIPAPIPVNQPYHRPSPASLVESLLMRSGKAMRLASCSESSL